MKNKELIYDFSNNDTFFIVIRDLKLTNKISDIYKKSNKKYLTIVFDFENLSKEINEENDYYLKFEQFIKTINNNLNLVFKNTLIRNKNMYFKDEKLNLNQLCISDELYNI